MIQQKTPKKIKGARKKRRVKEKEKESKPLCEYAVLGKEISENYPFPYKCGVMYECRYYQPTKKKAENCPRKQIGDNRKEKRHEQRSGDYTKD